MVSKVDSIGVFLVALATLLMEFVLGYHRHKATAKSGPELEIGEQVKVIFRENQTVSAPPSSAPSPRAAPDRSPRATSLTVTQPACSCVQLDTVSDFVKISKNQRQILALQKKLTTLAGGRTVCFVHHLSPLARSPARPLTTPSPPRPDRATRHTRGGQQHLLLRHHRLQGAAARDPGRARVPVVGLAPRHLPPWPPLAAGPRLRLPRLRLRGSGRVQLALHLPAHLQTRGWHARLRLMRRASQCAAVRVTTLDFARDG